MRRFIGLVLLAGILGVFCQAQISTFPHIEDFELEYQCPHGCGATCFLIGTWKNDMTGIDDLDWSSEIGPTPSGGTGPVADHTLGNQFGHYVYIESSCENTGWPSKSAFILSSYYDFTALTPPVYLEFWFHTRGSGISDGSMHVDIDTAQGAGSWILNITPPWIDDLNEWQKKTIDISAYAGLDSVRFRIRGVTGSNAASDICIDDILVFTPVTTDLGITDITGPENGCHLPDSVPVIVEITNYGLDTLYPGTSIPAYYSVNSGDTIFEILTLTDTLGTCESYLDTFATGADLSIVDEYVITAWPAFGGDTTSFNDSRSLWVEHFPNVDPGGWPYKEDFEDGAATWRTGGENSTWALGTPAKPVISGAYSGDNAWVTGGLGGQYNNQEDSYVMSGCWDFTDLCSPRLRMKTWWNSENGFDGTVVQYSLNGGRTWTRLGSFFIPDQNWYNSDNVWADPGGQNHGWTGTDTMSSGGWVTSETSLLGLLGQEGVLLRVAFAADLDVRGEGFAFDDVQIIDGIYLGDDTTICEPGSVTLGVEATSFDTVTWSTGATTDTISITSPGTYWVRVGLFSSCAVTDTIEVVGVTPTYSVSLGPDTTVCGSYPADAGYLPGVEYLWSNGATSQIADLDATGDYWVDVFTPCGTVRSDTLSLTILPTPPTDLGPDTTGCGSYLLDAGTGGASYLWSTGETSSSIEPSASGDYSVTVTATNGCITIDSIALEIVPGASIDLGPDTSICDIGDTVCIDGAASASGPGTFLWSTTETTPGICVIVSGEYSLTFTDTIGCSAIDTILVTGPDAPTAGIDVDSSGCPDIAFSDASTGGTPTFWNWDFGDGSISTDANPVYDYSSSGNGTYFVTLLVGNGCGVDSTIVAVEVNCVIGIEDEINRLISVYPNPNEGQFQIRFENIQSGNVGIEIFDLLGREIYQKDLDRIDGTTIEKVILPRPYRGWAFVRIILEGKTYTRKLLFK